jgi:uncharacterized circularly permuted ATP-grasp superfamily protein
MLAVQETLRWEDPILNNVETYRMTNPDERQYPPENLNKLVVKAVDVGEYGEKDQDRISAPVGPR